MYFVKKSLETKHGFGFRVRVFGFGFRVGLATARELNVAPNPVSCVSCINTVFICV